MTHAVHSSLAPWRVRASIYSQLLASGRAPTLAQLAHASEATQDEVREALAILAWNQQVVLQADGELLAAEPFSAVPTPFVVDIGAAWPAWGFGICCSLGIGAMAGRDARVTTHCGHCFRRLEIRVEDGRCSGADGAVAQFVVPADHAVRRPGASGIDNPKVSCSPSGRPGASPPSGTGRTGATRVGAAGLPSRRTRPSLPWDFRPRSGG